VRRQSDRLGTRSCDVEAQRQRASDGELDRGGIQVSTRRNEGCQHTAPTQLRARVSSATQGPRQRAFGRVSSASGAGGARLRRRAPGAGIPAGAATGNMRAADSIDATLHDTRRQCDGSRRQVGIEVV
jgi:hypothetical protein